jgi:hypothetical protein
MSFFALLAAGAFAAYVFRRERRIAMASDVPYTPVPLAIPPQGPQPERGSVVEAL